MAAVVFITSKPIDAFLRGQWEPGFRFLPVNYDARFEDYYLPASLEDPRRSPVSGRVNGAFRTSK